MGDTDAVARRIAGLPADHLPHPPDRIRRGMLRGAGARVKARIEVVVLEGVRLLPIQEEHGIPSAVPEPAPQLVIAGNVVVISRQHSGEFAAEAGDALRGACNVAARHVHRFEQVSRDHQEVGARLVCRADDPVQAGETRLHERRARGVGVPGELHAQVQV